MRRRDGGELLPAILRIDADKPFLRKKSFTKRNIFFLSTGSFFRKKVLGCMRFITKDYKDFSRDLTKISKRFDGKVYGFTKHGSGKFKLSRRLI